MTSSSRRPFASDVAVVGAGPIGLGVALGLAHRGIRVALFEREPATSIEPRAVSMIDETLRYLESVGALTETVRDDILFDTDTRFFGVNDVELAHVVPPVSTQGFPTKSLFDQPSFDSALSQLAEEHRLIDIRWNTEVTDIAQHDDSVTLTVDGPESPSQLTVHAVVGCDGGKSFVRKSQAIALNGSTQVERWIVVDVENEQITTRTTEFHCNGKRPVVVVPGVKNRCRYEFMLLPEERPEVIENADFVNRLLQEFRPSTTRTVRRSKVYVAQRRVAETFNQGRVLIAGDSAHLMPPFAGQGLNSGFRDAANLVWKLAEVVHGTASPKLLNTYTAERADHAREMVTVSGRLGLVIMNTQTSVSRLRDRLLAATRLLPPLNDWLTSMRYIRYPHLSPSPERIIQPKPPRNMIETVGRILPNPLVSDGDREPQRLDSVLGTDWALVGTDAAALTTLATPALRNLRSLVSASVVIVGQGIGRTSSPGNHVEESQFGDVLTVSTASDIALPEIDAGQFLLVRPDRYVAGVVDEESAADITGLLATYFMHTPQPEEA